MKTGFAPEATIFNPSLINACAKTVAVVVPSPATSFDFVATSFTICAPKFSIGSSNSISFAIVTPSFVIIGIPNPLSNTTFLPLGPNVIFTASANVSTPISSDFLASSLNFITFDIFHSPSFLIYTSQLLLKHYLNSKLNKFHLHLSLQSQYIFHE